MRKLFLLLCILLSLPGAGFAQNLASPYSNAVFPAQIFTTTGQTGKVLQLNGLTVASTVGSSFASGTITVTGVSLTTVTFTIQGSSDNGITFFPLPVNSVASPGTLTTTATATVNGMYQVSLAGLTHVRFVTSGTYTATSVSITLTASPNALTSRNSAGGGGGATLPATPSIVASVTTLTSRPAIDGQDYLSPGTGLKLTGGTLSGALNAPNLASKGQTVSVMHPDFGSPSGCSVVMDPTFTNNSSCAFQAAINFAENTTIGGQVPQVYIPSGHYKVAAPLTITAPLNIVADKDAVITKAFNGNLFTVSASNVTFSGKGTLDGGGFIGAGNITSVTGSGTTATYTYTLTSGATGVTGNVAVVTGCTTSPSGGFNGLYPLTAGSASSFTVANTTSGTESESTCTVQFMYGGDVLDANNVSQVNILGMTVQHGGINGILLNNVTNSSVKDSQIIQNGQSGVAVAGTGVEGITISGDTFDCTNATNQDNDCLSFKATPPNTQKAGSVIAGNHFTQGAGFSIEMQYLGHSVKVANNDCNIVPTPIISSSFPGFAIFSCYSLQIMMSTVEHNTAINLTGQPADFPLDEWFGYKNSYDGNVIVGGDVFLYAVESTFESNHILLGQLLVPSGNETGNPVGTGSIIAGNEINTSCAKPGQAWTANTKLQAFYCITDSNGNIEITVSDHAAANMTGATQPTWPTGPHAIGTTTIDNNMTWLNIGTPVYGDAGSVGSVTGVVSNGTTAIYSYTVTSGSGPVVGNSAVVARCTNSALNGVFTINATGTGTFSTANSATVTETESKCGVTFTKGRGAISVICNAAGLNCNDTQILHNTLIDNYSPNGTGVTISAATGAQAANVTVKDNNFIGFTNCYSISPLSSATAILYNNREHNCTNLGTINQASHISLEQLIETTQRNFVPNSGFKFGGDGWTINPAYTIFSGNAAEGSGQGLQYVSTGSAPGAVFAISKPITVIPGQKWTVSSNIDATPATSGSPVSVAFDRCDAGLSYIQAIQQNGIAGPVSASGTIPSGVTSGCLIASVGTAVSPASSNFFFSAIQMEPGSLVTPYKENDWSNTDTTIPSAVLPIGSSTVLGGIKCGSGLTCAGDGTASVSGSGATNVAYSFCSGTASASGTALSFFGLGDTATACTGTAAGGAGLLMATSGTMSKLSVRCATTGVNASSGAFTVFDSPSGAGGSATALTVTYGLTTAGTDLQDNTHTVNYASGDLITVRYTTQAAETLANCAVSFRY